MEHRKSQVFPFVLTISLFLFSCHTHSLYPPSHSLCLSLVLSLSLLDNVTELIELILLVDSTERFRRQRYGLVL